MAYAIVKVLDLITLFKYALANNWGYIWSMAGEIWTQAKQEALVKKYNSDPKKYADLEMGVKYGSKWIGHTVSDCSGLFSWAFKKLGSYMYHGSNTMWLKYCVNQGELKGGKRTDGKELKPGTAVFTYNAKKKNRGHVGLYIGNGEVIEAEGTQKGVIKSKITNSKWVEWGELKYVDYINIMDSNEPVSETKPVSSGSSKVSVSYPTIREGEKGEIVVQLQTLLSKAGSGLAIDGIFGSGTRSAVRAFQKKYGLEVDGIVGPKTWTKLLEVAGNIQVSPPEPEPLVCLMIPDLKKSEADELIRKYPKAEKVYTAG